MAGQAAEATDQLGELRRGGAEPGDDLGGWAGSASASGW
jgi:hypothetical protein